jgi:hypothetical protein
MNLTLYINGRREIETGYKSSQIVFDSAWQGDLEDCDCHVGQLMILEPILTLIAEGYLCRSSLHCSGGGVAGPQVT